MMPMMTMTAFADGWADFSREGDGTQSNPWQIGVTGSESSVTAYLDGGTLIISGMGAMMDFNNLANRPWDGSRASVTTVTISSGVTTIGSNAFQACDNLASVSIPNTVTSIGDFAFEGWDKVSALTSVTIPDSVTSIGYSAFNKAGLTSVTIPDSVTTIGDNAFRACSNLTSISLSNSITAVSKRLFSRCTSLESVTIPASVTTIAPYVFDECGTVPTSITVEATTPPTLETESYGGKDYDAFAGLTTIPTIYVPAASVEAYKTAAGWSAYKDNIKAKSTPAPTPAPTPDNTDKGVKTGDSSDIIFYGFTTLLALLGAGFVYGLRRKEEK